MADCNTPTQVYASRFISYFIFFFPLFLFMQIKDVFGLCMYEQICVLRVELHCCEACPSKMNKTLLKIQGYAYIMTCTLDFFVVTGKGQKLKQIKFNNFILFY